MARIAVDLTPLRPGGENGGVKVLARELLRAFGKAGVPHDFLLLTAPWNHDELAEFEGPTMKRLRVLEEASLPSARRPPGRFARTLARLARRIRRALPAPSFGSFPLRSRNVALLFCPFTAPTFREPGIPVVSVIHDLQHRDYPAFFTPEEVAERDSFLADVRARAARIVAVSESVRRSVVAGLDVDPKRTRVIPNAIHFRLGKSDPAAAAVCRERMGLRTPFFFYPANFWPHKNHRMLLTAYGMLRARLGDETPEMVFTGAPCPEQDAIRFAAERMGLADRVHFLGYLSEAEFDAVWRGCFALVFPSLYEGFGIPLLEAMALGKPVLASGVTSLPEVGGDAALYFDPRLPTEMAGVMTRIVRDPALAGRLAERGRARLARFSPDEMTRRYLDLFAEVLNCPEPVREGVEGLFSDGWAGGEIHVALRRGRTGHRLAFELEAPESAPHPYFDIQVRSNDGEARQDRLRRGDRVGIHLEITNTTSWIALSVSPVFRPVDWDMGPDTRSLGVRVLKCRLTAPDGRSVALPMGDS
jgi:glycosyltransferase involved in cell wall biosynthesis